MNDYLIEQPVGKLMMKFSIPCIASLLISCLYNIADQMFVGNGIGYVANAATGIIFPLTVLGLGLALLFGDGAAAAYSLKQGTDKTPQIGLFTGQTIWMTFLTGLVITVIYFLFPEQVLAILGSSEGVADMARQYGNIIVLFIPFAMLQNALSPVIRAHGAPGYAMLCMVCGAVFNIIGDWLAVFVFQSGIQGAAWATVLGQVLSLVLSLIYFMRPKQMMLHPSDFKLHQATDLQIIRLGVSSFLSQFSIVIITVVNNLLLVHYGALSEYGPEIPLAAFVVLMKLFQVVVNIAVGIGAGCQPIAGTNFTAGKQERIRVLFKRMMIVTTIMGLAATACFFLFTRELVSIFGAQDALYMSFAIQVVRIYLSLITLTCLQKVCSIFMQSVGQAGSAAFLSILRDGLLILFSIAFAQISGLNGIFYAAVAADLCAFAITAVIVIRFFARMPMLIKRQQELYAQA